MKLVKQAGLTVKEFLEYYRGKIRGRHRETALILPLAGHVLSWATIVRPRWNLRA